VVAEKGPCFLKRESGGKEKMLNKQEVEKGHNTSRVEQEEEKEGEEEERKARTKDRGHLLPSLLAKLFRRMSPFLPFTVPFSLNEDSDPFGSVFPISEVNIFRLMENF
jgi:hypothetical protein